MWKRQPSKLVLKVTGTPDVGRRQAEEGRRQVEVGRRQVEERWSQGYDQGSTLFLQRVIQAESCL